MVPSYASFRRKVESTGARCCRTAVKTASKITDLKKSYPDVDYQQVGAKRNESSIRKKFESIRIVKENEAGEKQKTSRGQRVSQRASEEEQKMGVKRCQTAPACCVAARSISALHECIIELKQIDSSKLEPCTIHVLATTKEGAQKTTGTNSASVEFNCPNCPKKLYFKTKDMNCLESSSLNSRSRIT